MLLLSLALPLFLLSEHTAAFVFKIRTSLSEIDSQRDESLEIECFYNPDESDKEPGFSSVHEIHIVRRDASDNWSELAKLQSNGHVEKGTTDLQVYGNIGTRLNDTFLKIYREHASKDDLGIYRCDVVIHDENFSLDVEESNLLTMSKHNLTLEEVSENSQRQIDNLQSEFDKFRQNAQKKFARLEKSVKQLKNESQSQDDNSDDDVTKEDLDQLKEDITRSLLANVSAQVEEMSCSRLTQCGLSSSKDTAQSGSHGTTTGNDLDGPSSVDQPDSSILDGQQESPNLDGQQDSSNLDGQQDPSILDGQPYSSILDDQQDSSNLDGQQDGSNLDGQEWPAGSFGLLNANSGCPSTNLNQRWKEGYIRYHTESVDENHNNVTYGHHLAEPAIEVSQSGKHFIYMHFCIGDNFDSDNMPWPVGAYCINRVGSKCPADFQSGYIDLDEEDTEFEIEGNVHGALPDMLYFCCRVDGSPDIPITLPSSRPFYLYRFGGKCQQVKDMQVTPERILFDTENENNQDDYENDVHPDGKLEDIEIELCYYS